MLGKIKSALVLAPHPDDGELGCGGTIARLAAMGVEISYWAFSPCVKSLPEGFEGDPDTLFKEMIAATQKLGIDAANVRTSTYKVRRFPEYRQEILEEMYEVARTTPSLIVLTPSTYDFHQDHLVITQEAIRAFRDCTILGYEFPRNTRSFETNCFVRLQDEHLWRKVQAVTLYASQRERSYTSETMIRALAKIRGNQCGYGAAEAFEVIRCVL